MLRKKELSDRNNLKDTKVKLEETEIEDGKSMCLVVTTELFMTSELSDCSEWISSR
jgi:hypothetical protein